jgi:hypothetical protein
VSAVSHAAVVGSDVPLPITRTLSAIEVEELADAGGAPTNATSDAATSKAAMRVDRPVNIPRPDM